MIRTCILGLLLAAAFTAGCERPDDELAANPSLVDPDRDHPESAPAVTSVRPTSTARRPPMTGARKDVASIASPLGPQALARTDTPAGPQAEGLPGSSGLVVNEPERAPGFTLLTVLKERRAFLLDEAGNRVHVWHDAAARSWESTLLLPDGDLLVVGAIPGNRRRGVPDADRYLERISWQGAQRWRQKIAAHDQIVQRPDGRVSVLSYTLRDDPDVHREARVRDDVILVLDTDGNEIERHSVHDAVTASDMEVLPQGARPTASGAGWVNLYNSRSLDWGTVADDPAALNRTDCVLVAMANQKRVGVIDTSAGRLIWSWGRDEIDVPGSARFLPNGNVLVFDNGTSSNRSRVLEVEPASGEIVWTYESDGGRIFFSASRGMGQRLGNGNTLITSTDQGEALEVTPDGRTVWRFLTLANRMNKRKPVAAAWRYDADRVLPLLEKFGPDEPAAMDDEAADDETNEDDYDDEEDEV